jgi:ferric-dicitrate binding protein FerR (iron transport regulator)
MKEHLQQYIDKYDRGELSHSEHLQMADQLADPENVEAGQVLHKEWEFQLASDQYSSRNFSHILDLVHHQIRLNEYNRTKNSGWWFRFQRIAAILVIGILFSFTAYLLLMRDEHSMVQSYAEIQCPLGVRTKFELPDGTKGFLNSGSKLKYALKFSGARSVELTGEAYFEVVHKDRTPFHVNTRNLDIKVLGTSFNVLANENDNTEEVVLQTGKVEISDQRGRQLTTMIPNEQFVLDPKNQTFSKKEIEASQYTSWKEGKLVFRKEHMQQVAKRLSRWYNAEVVVADRQLDEYTFHATFMDEPLEEVLKLISITTPINYSEEIRTSDREGLYPQRKIILRINQSKINQFK